jgi:dihydroorotate dehydrogenase electron transfer subunit
MQATPTPGVFNDDGTLTARVVERVDNRRILHLCMPGDIGNLPAPLAGAYLLARAGSSQPDRGDDWGIYLRRPLFFSGRYRLGPSEIWRFYLPQDDDPGHRWLGQLPENSSINLIGPLGNGFQLAATTQNLLLLVDYADDQAWLPWLLPLVDLALDLGQKVTLIIRANESLPDGMLSALPLALEVQTVLGEGDWQLALGETVRWADQICAGIPPARYTQLHQAVRAVRFRSEEGFVQVLVKADLLCGIGACLACVIPLARGGHTRACEHGPVFDLTQLVG